MQGRSQEFCWGCVWSAKGTILVVPKATMGRKWGDWGRGVRVSPSPPKDGVTDFEEAMQNVFASEAGKKNWFCAPLLPF